MSGKDKWLRIHNTQEWPDLYDPQYGNDLAKFFDHFMKGIDNGWEKTPRVRMAVLDPCGVGKPGFNYEPIEGGPGPGGDHYTVAKTGKQFPYPKPEIDVKEYQAKAELLRSEKAFPLEREVFHHIYLDASDMKMKPRQPVAESEATFKSDDYMDHVTFTYVFDNDTEVTGYSKVRLWMSTQDNDDMDVFVRISKLNAKGENVFHWTRMWEYSGPNGMLRASLRELDPWKSTESEPVQRFDSVLRIEKGKPVAMDIGLWPTSMVFHKGEAIQVNVAGFDYLGIMAPWDNPVTCNYGNMTMHTGGKYDSFFCFPTV
jgi:predicted acyl esterase